MKAQHGKKDASLELSKQQHSGIRCMLAEGIPCKAKQEATSYPTLIHAPCSSQNQQFPSLITRRQYFYYNRPSTMATSSGASCVPSDPMLQAIIAPEPRMDQSWSKHVKTLPHFFQLLRWYLPAAQIYYSGFVFHHWIIDRRRVQVGK